MCSLAEMTFNRSQLGMCVVTRGHFRPITIKISPGDSPGEQRQGHGHRGGKQLPPSLPLVSFMQLGLGLC